MAVPIAELMVLVGADTSAAIAGLNGLDNKLKSTTQRFREAAPAAALLTGAAAGIGAVFGGAISVAADFEHQMAAVKSVMTTDEVDQFGVALKDLALKLGRDTVFTSREAASAIEELVKAGLPVEAVLNGAASAALNLAAATGVSTAEAASITGQALNTFKINASQSADVVDRLSGVANKSASDISFLGFGLASVGGVAAGLGLSFDDTAVGLGIMSKSFKTGSDAGTSFKRFLETLQPRSKAQIQLAEKLGITTNGVANAFFDSAGHVKTLAGLGGVLQNAFRGMTDEQRNFAEGTLFGSDAIRAAEAIYQAGAQGVQQFKDETGQSGTAAASAKTRMDSLTGAMQSLGGSFETIQITVGDLFTPALRGMADALKGALDAFSSMSPEAQGAAVAIFGILGAVAGLAGGFGVIGLAITTLGPSFAALGGLIAGVLPFVLPLVAIFGLLVAAWQADLGGIQGIVSNAFGQIPAVLNFLGTKFQEAGKFWTTSIVPAVSRIGSAIGAVLGPAIRNVASGPLGNLGTVFKKVFAGDIGGAVDTFQAILGALVPGLGPVLVGIRSFAERLGVFIKDGVDRFGPILANVGIIFQKVFSGDVGGAFDTLRAIIGAIFPDFLRFIDKVGEIKDAVFDAFGKAAEFVSNSALGQAVGKVFDSIGTVFNTIISGDGQKILDFFGKLLPQPFKDLGASIGPTLEQVFGSIALIFDAIIHGHGQGVIDFFKDKLPAPLKALGALLEGPVGTTFAALGTIFGLLLAGRGQEALDFFEQSLPDAFKTLGASLEGPVSAAFATIGTVFNAITSGNGDLLVKMFQESLPQALKDLGAALEGPITTAITTFTEQVMPKLNDAARIVKEFWETQLLPALQNPGAALDSFATSFEAAQARLAAAAKSGALGQTSSDLATFFAQFDTIKAQVASLEPLFTSIGNFASALGELNNAVTGLEEKKLASWLESLTAAAGPAAPAATAIATAMDLIGPKLQGITDFFTNAAAAARDFAKAIREVPATPASGSSAAGGGLEFDPSKFFDPTAPIFGPGGLVHKSAFNPAGGAGGGGNVIITGPISINGGVELEEFALTIASAISGSARRVNPPPDNSGSPQLVLSFA